MHFLRSILLIGFLIFPGFVSATLYVLVDDGVLADQAQLVVEGQVLSSRSASVEGVWTDYMIALQSVIQGRSPATTVTVRVPGGVREDGLALQISGVPRWQVGDRVVLFLTPETDHRGVNSTGPIYRILHLMQGAFHLQQVEGRSLAHRQLWEAQEVSFNGQDRSILHHPRDWSKWSSWLQDRSRGFHRPADYFLEPGSLKFTLLVTGGPPVRWLEFEVGGTVTHLAHVDGQPGLAGGGFAEFQTALAAWTDDIDSNIRYVYGGTTNATGGLTTFDGVNAILFDDPNGLFEEPFDCATGGTLGAGGPWSTSAGQHTHQGMTFNETIGADVVMNQGLECWINSVNAAEVFAHELGHTLGLGHSCGDAASGACDTMDKDDALMRANAHNDGRGASLRADDRAGAAFLYGEGDSIFADGFESGDTTAWSGGTG